jgi:hypothetical protein
LVFNARKINPYLQLIRSPYSWWAPSLLLCTLFRSPHCPFLGTHRLGPGRRPGGADPLHVVRCTAHQRATAPCARRPQNTHAMEDPSRCSFMWGDK